MSDERQADVMKLHLLEQVSLYGEQILVNLVNQKGHEQPVKDAFERYITQARTRIFRCCKILMLFRS